MSAAPPSSSAGVRIRLARTAAELDALFALRHRIMVDDEGYLPPQAGARLADRFDAYPTTANIVALVDDRIVGGIRFTERSAAGTAADAYFDFAPHLPDGARDVAAGMLVLERAYRATPRLSFALFSMGYHWSIQRGATHVLAPANPRRRDGCLRMGYHAVAPAFVHEPSGLPVVPMILDLAELDDRALEFLRRHGTEHWLSSFERLFHSAGDNVLRRGDSGNEAYVIVSGTASVRGPRLAPPVQLGPGELFGELASLTGGPRTADIVAETDLDLMVLDGDAFRAQVHTDTDAGQRMLELVAGRMAQALGQVSQAPLGSGR
jgi:N-acyl-L-homoserine lactone synthetase